MRTVDLTPFYRSTVGFDQITDLLDRVLTKDVATPSYPPYNIVKTAEDAWQITVAVAGFSDSELGLEQRENELIVTAKKAGDEADKTYLHRGIATRAFERRFHLADHVRVTGAQNENGLLHIALEREVPEALKPRKIDIAAATPVNTIEA
jgi:molecular chaperone IbpA